ELADAKLPAPCHEVLTSLQEHRPGLIRFLDDRRIPLVRNELQGWLLRCSCKRSSSERNAARSCRIASAPASPQDFSVPFTRRLKSFTVDSTWLLVHGKPFCR